MAIKNREQLVKDLVSTYEERSEIHAAYKKKMKEIILHAFCEFAYDMVDQDPDDIKEADMEEWINNFVEESFTPKD